MQNCAFEFYLLAILKNNIIIVFIVDSLNLNSYLTLLACISPHREDLSETLSTLRFAQNAKQLKNTPQINSIIADIKVSIENKQVYMYVVLSLNEIK